jgi:hypothetical protein
MHMIMGYHSERNIMRWPASSELRVLSSLGLDALIFSKFQLESLASSRIELSDHARICYFISAQMHGYNE